MKHIIESLKDINGAISSKRVIMYAAFLLFGTEILANIFWCKTLDSSLQVQLFSLLLTCLGLVFGEQAKTFIDAAKKTNKIDEQQP
jgi:hypothetical protein